MRTRASVLLIFVLWAAVYVPGLFRPALLDDADSAHAEAAREMAAGGDWVVLHLNNGFRYLEKAPLMYWTIAASFKAFGVSEWSARLPLVLFVLAAMLAVYALGRRVYGESGGLYAAAILGTGFGTFLFTRILIPDIITGLWITLGLHFFLMTLDEERPSRLACWGFAAVAALGVLTKGLIGILFPVAIAGAYLIFTGNVRHVARMRPLSSTLVLLLIAAPWHVLAALRTPDMGEVRGWLWFYFMNEHVLRYLGLREPKDYDTVPFAVFWGGMLLWIFPWTVFLPQALAQVPVRWRAWRSKLDEQARANLLFALWALIILVFFTFSTRQEYYVVPAFPALALLIGGWLEREEQPEPAARRAGRRSALVLFVLGAVACAFAVALALGSEPPPPGSDISDLLKQNPHLYAMSLGHFFDLTPAAMGAFRAPLLATAFALLLGTGAAWWFRRRGEPGKGNAALAAMGVVILLSALQGLVIFSPVLTSKPLAEAIGRELKPGEIIVVNGEYEEGSTLNFYLGEQLHILNGRRANLWYGSKFPDAPKIFHDDASFRALWRGERRVYLWSPEEKLERALADLERHEIARSGGKVVVSNRR